MRTRKEILELEPDENAPSEAIIVLTDDLEDEANKVDKLEIITEEPVEDPKASKDTH